MQGYTPPTFECDRPANSAVAPSLQDVPAAASVSASAAASTSSLYAFTGFEPSDAFSKTSLYRIDPRTRVPCRLSSTMIGVLLKSLTATAACPGKPPAWRCPVSADGVIFGMPGLATDSPMLVHAPVTNVSSATAAKRTCVGHHDTAGTHSFAAFYSHYAPRLGTFTLGMGILSMSADPSGPAATFEQKLGWDESDKKGRAGLFCLRGDGRP